MPDREKVIKALEHCVLPSRKGWPYCSNIAGSCCESDDCPYYQDDCDQMLFDALALLKEQEPKFVLSMRRCHYERKGFCPKCNQVVEWYLNRAHCGFCGQELKWDD